MILYEAQHPHAKNQAPNFTYPYADFIGLGQEKGRGRIALVGLPGVGKKTLYNCLWEMPILTSQMSIPPFVNLGLFSLLDLPKQLNEGQDYLLSLESYDLLIYLLEAPTGLSPEDFQWLARLRAIKVPLLIILGKTKLLPPQELAHKAEAVRQKLALPLLVLDSRVKHELHELFLPAILKLCPDLAVPLAEEIPSLRLRVANSFIQQTLLKTGRFMLEEGGSQEKGLGDLHLEMVKHIAQVYGHRLQEGDSQDLELVHWCSSLVQNLALQMSQEFKGLNTNPRLLASLILAASTWSLGQFAKLYYNDNLWASKWGPVWPWTT
jgi:Fe2+ transport system protein B